MTYILRKPLANGWAARTSRIKQSVMRSSDEVEAAERELNAIEALTKTIPQEEERIKKEIAEQGDAEAAEIIRQAEQRAARIRQQATELIKGETRSAQSSFRQALVERAVQITKERFGAGDFTARENVYQTAAITRAKQLVQH
jgi:F0F1-type ATP synthase membrane subunit b/b'